MSDPASRSVSDVFARRSLAGRLTAWFAGLTFILVAIATASLYSSVMTSLRNADNHLLIDRVRTLRAVLHSSGLDVPKLIEEIEHEWPGGENAHVYARLLDSSGRVIAQTRGIAERDLPAAAFPVPSNVGHVTEPPVDRSEASGREFELYAVQLDTGASDQQHVTLQLALDATDHKALLASYRGRMSSVLTIMLFVATSIGYLVARRGLRPISRFEESLRHIRSTTLYERLDPSGLPTELSMLAKTCNEMLDGLEESFAKLSRFSADLAHELRTPVNNLRGEVEVAITRERSPEEYRAVLGSCLEEAQRLSKVIDSLLFLARAEGTKIQTQIQPLDLHRELIAVIDFYEALASEAGVTLWVDVPESLVANVDRALFQSAVGNLVHNAITATAHGGRVSVRAEREGHDVRIEVSDTGCGISSVDLPRVFDRLYRVDEARSGAGSSGGAGLGLAIVKSIAALHRGSASIRSQEGVGTTATLRFPADITIS